MTKHLNSRTFSLFFITLALVTPFIIYFLRLFIFNPPAPSKPDSYVCGQPVVVMVMFAVFLMITFNIISVIFGSYSFIKLNSPRPLSRKLELLAIVMPLILIAGLMGISTLVK